MVARAGRHRARRGRARSPRQGAGLSGRVVRRGAAAWARARGCRGRAGPRGSARAPPGGTAAREGRGVAGRVPPPGRDTGRKGANRRRAGA
jgi:hypothetical protein